MKKRIILGLGIICCLLMTFLLIKFLTNRDVSSDEKKFKKEYESINDSKWVSNGEEGKYLSIKLPKDNLMKYANNDTILELMTKGTHVVYFGNAHCNWCRSSVPVLIDAAKEEELKEIYYYDFFGLRAAYEGGSNPILVDLYKDLIDVMGEFIDTTFGDDSKVAGEKRISAPTVVVISEGKVVDLHYKTVDDHSNYNKDLTKKQKNELKDIYMNMFKKMVFVCGDNC